MTTQPATLFLLLASTVVGAAPEPLRLGDTAFRVGERFRRATLSPDGTTAALAGNNGRFYLLDIASGRTLRTWQHPAEVQALGFDDADRIRVLDGRGWVLTFDPTTGRQVGALGLLAEPPVPCDGEFFAGGRYLLRQGFHGWDTAESLFDAVTGVELAIRATKWERPLFSPDGSRVLVPLDGSPFLRLLGDGDPLKTPGRRAVVVDLATYQPLAVLPLGEMGAGTFTPDGHLVMQRRHGEVVHADATTGRLRSLPLAGLAEMGSLQRLSVSRTGRLAGLFATDGPPRVAEWELATGRLLGCWSLPDERITRLAYAGSGKLLAWNDAGERLLVVDLHARRTNLGVGHRAGVCALRFASEHVLESLDAHGRILRWDATTGRLLGEEYLPVRWTYAGSGHTDGHVRAFDATGRRVLVEHPDGRAWCDRRRGYGPDLPTPRGDRTHSTPDGRYDLYLRGEEFVVEDREAGRPWPLPAVGDLWPLGAPWIAGFAVAADGRHAALLAAPREDDEPGDTQVAVVDVRTRRVVARGQVAGRNRTLPPVLAADGSLVAIPAADGLTLWHTATARTLRFLAAPEAGYLAPLAFAPDGRSVLIRAEGETPELLLIEVATGTARCRWNLRDAPAAGPQFSPDGRRLAYPQGDGTILLLPTDAPAKRLDHATLWRDLGSTDAAVANVAVQALASDPDARRKIAARAAISKEAEAPFDPLEGLAELDADDPDIREAAKERLRGLPRGTLEGLAATVVRQSPEVRRSLQELLDEPHLTRQPTACELRRLRLAEVLDRIASKRE